MKPVTSEIMAEIDRRAIEDFGIPEEHLMENAGRSVADVIISENSPINRKKIIVFCGKGNNGGDGFVVARHLAELAPRELVVFSPGNEEIRRGPAKKNYSRLSELSGVTIRGIGSVEGITDICGFDIVVDSIFGTGFKGEMKDPYVRAARLMNGAGARVYSVDVPSGLNATTGEAGSDCVKAYRTVTFGLPKEGFYLRSGPGVCGDVSVRDIGFPDELLAPFL
ncbi:MAG: NAD(P)H-hydrate epimerase [Candidatus Omnitrophica bacterium]|nr:NAD(P)H-hydrate epimerase [Candidatus Omnitrophota bacterium]MDD5488812.1 NAD(P)H-hydrate epimerase [Candidatus Omnitrophota bacterium]